jgi:hypothetical protein
MNPESIIKDDFNYSTPELLKPSSREDKEEGIDGWICGFPFAYRKRRMPYDDITIRYKRSSGAKTEYVKILEGTFRAKIFLYEFPDKTVLCSTDSIKRSLEKHLFDVIPNKDGTTFLMTIKLKDVHHLIWKKDAT